MFVINDDLSIYLTRGDAVTISLNAMSDLAPYTFIVGDIVRLKVFEKKACHCVVLQKDVQVTEASETVDIALSGDDTKFCELISKPTDYWYEIELNPETAPQTIIGYDDNGPKVFRLFPEGGDLV
jgi:hypothetical protein